MDIDAELQQEQNALIEVVSKLLAQPGRHALMCCDFIYANRAFDTCRFNMWEDLRIDKNRMILSTGAASVAFLVPEPQRWLSMEFESVQMWGHVQMSDTLHKLFLSRVRSRNPAEASL